MIKELAWKEELEHLGDESNQSSMDQLEISCQRTKTAESWIRRLDLMEVTEERTGL